MYYVYVLQNTISFDLYIGYTSDLKRRVIEHNRKNKSSFTTNQNGNWLLVYYESYKSQIDAQHRELRLKNHGSGKKELYKRLENSLLA